MSPKCRRTAVIVEGIDPADLAELASVHGFGEMRFRAEDLGGYTEIVDGQVVAIGGVAVHADGRIWAGLMGPCKPLYHRLAVRFLRALAAQGVREVWADTLPEGAAANEKWMQRLGFEEQPNGDWRLCLQQH